VPINDFFVHHIGMSSVPPLETFTPLLEWLLSSADRFLLLVTETDSIIAATPAARKYFVALGDSLDKRLVHLFPLEALNFLRKPQEGQFRAFEWLGEDKCTRFQVNLMAKALAWQGQTLRLLEIQPVTSDDKRSKKYENLNRAIRGLFDPITVISAYSEMLLQKQVGQHPEIPKIQRSAHRLAERAAEIRRMIDALE
jgi:hypothetical protein